MLEGHGEAECSSKVCEHSGGLCAHLGAEPELLWVLTETSCECELSTRFLVQKQCGHEEECLPSMFCHQPGLVVLLEVP